MLTLNQDPGSREKAVLQNGHFVPKGRCSVKVPSFQLVPSQLMAGRENIYKWTVPKG